MSADRLSREDIDKRLVDIEKVHGIVPTVERIKGDYTGGGHYIVYSWYGGRKYYDSIKEVLAFLDGILVVPVREAK